MARARGATDCAIDVLYDDCFHCIAQSLITIPLYGPYATVHLSWCSKNLHGLLRSLAPEARRKLEQSWICRSTFTIKGVSMYYRCNHEFGPIFTNDHGHKWRLKVYPFGNKTMKNGAPTCNISVYVDAANLEDQPWTPDARVFYTVHNAKASRSIYRDSWHYFTPKCRDWGFREMLDVDAISHEDLLGPSMGFVVNDELTVSAEVCVHPDERFGFAWLRAQLQKGREE